MKVMGPFPEQTTWSHTSGSLATADLPHQKKKRERRTSSSLTAQLFLVGLSFLSRLAGQLRAINPENGFFGVAPGTSATTNPNAMATIQSNTVFTNVAETSDGGVYWEGIDQPLPPGVTVTSWLGKPWKPGMWSQGSALF